MRSDTAVFTYDVRVFRFYTSGSVLLSSLVWRMVLQDQTSSRPQIVCKHLVGYVSSLISPPPLLFLRHSLPPTLSPPLYSPHVLSLPLSLSLSLFFFFFSLFLFFSTVFRRIVTLHLTPYSYSSLRRHCPYYVFAFPNARVSPSSCAFCGLSRRGSTKDGHSVSGLLQSVPPGE
jgi:hypothetical protein